MAALFSPFLLLSISDIHGQWPTSWTVDFSLWFKNSDYIIMILQQSIHTLFLYYAVLVKAY